jgi:hypothetical protein
MSRTNLYKRSEENRSFVLPEEMLYGMDDEIDAVCFLLHSMHEHPIQNGKKIFVCADCGVQNTPMIRSGGIFKGTHASKIKICNACGCRRKRYPWK